MKRRYHWFACQKCGDYKRSMRYDFNQEAMPPRKCKCGGDDFHYRGYVVDPNEAIASARLVGDLTFLAKWGAVIKATKLDLPKPRKESA